MGEVKYTEVPFEVMLQCDGEIICECWLLSNSINEFGVDLRKPMFFNEFLRQIGTHLTSMNCQSLFKQAKWYVVDDGIQTKQTNTTNENRGGSNNEKHNHSR
ncbi:hypothetical protein CN566_28320 [Bacillus wiedmannii]|uniref:hypothetical protein n=1 Tax=Bacillus wiedmannii TaxID=1890302 RepID=UPI000BF4A562|nr:hypothetical protein [Bacillus wiedmannii]PEP21711.1 hypothetical protein CN566_28320 [Bacillus wiedmannii]